MTNRPSASLGRRLLPAVAMTTAASGLVALLDQPSSGAAIRGGTGGAVVVPGQRDVAIAAQPPAVSSTVPAVVGQPAPSVAPVVPAAQQQPAAAATPTVAAKTTGACAGKTVDGPTVDTRWGPVQVEAIVSTSGQICNVDAIQSPSDHRRSVQINQRALPVLHSQVMKAQSTNINGVSGATITSRGYVRSLQSILDRAGG